MHHTLTEHARCLYGDEYRPAPACDVGHDEHGFIEKLTFADADTLVALLDELCPYLVDGHLPVRIRNLAYRLAVLQRPDDAALLRRAAESLWMHGPDWDDIATGLVQRADALDAAPVQPSQPGRTSPDS
ncbi:hypothetical protein [Streptomyces sp. VRA16 Mangrove soil]|uniref:hypothetical protein n=1 Tax=Streptomyces sp. VRA16 Mangrove soil TaxID=2817434 RepID=UPI001A9CC689|nr:hypothetical protein [Streptomyces sp. VRA16 Mangrove soil]MBO1334485.1 hypothetical protein [Streptomyces sp. VRA16 Mangrove soil]